MAKDEGAFLTIGEMAARLGVRTHILRYWEEQFPMLKPLTRAGGRRLYRPSDVALLEQINDLLHRQHYTIKGAVAFLRSCRSARYSPCNGGECASK
jgi:DNA-binding transcriptional MerR regulator